MSSPFACSPKALKEMTLSYFFVFLIGSRRRESNYFAQSVGTNVIISFCKVSTATEAPYGREKNLLAVPRNARGGRYSGFQVTGMIEGFFWLSREFLGGKAIWWFVIVSAYLDRVVLRINFYGRETWHGILWRFEFCPIRSCLSLSQGVLWEMCKWGMQFWFTGRMGLTELEGGL